MMLRRFRRKRRSSTKAVIPPADVGGGGRAAGRSRGGGRGWGRAAFSAHGKRGQPARCSRNRAVVSQACVPEIGTTRKSSSNTRMPP
jgi:hypothetical protein